MADPLELCTFCPRLCRHLCPVSLATGREAATPTAKITAVYLARRGALPSARARQAAGLCTSCGACTEHCAHNVPVWEILAKARRDYGAPPEARALGALQGEGPWVAVECDGRTWRQALAAALGETVARLTTSDHLGHALLGDERQANPWLTALRETIGNRRPVTSCARCREVLERAGLEFAWLADLRSCSWEGAWLACATAGSTPPATPPGALACCGAHGALPADHPEAAAEVAREAASRLPATTQATQDSITRNALRAAGCAVIDPIDMLIAPRAPR